MGSLDETKLQEFIEKAVNEWRAAAEGYSLLLATDSDYSERW